jgi:hypothetical protein
MLFCGVIARLTEAETVNYNAITKQKNLIRQNITLRSFQRGDSSVLTGRKSFFRKVEMKKSKQDKKGVCPKSFPNKRVGVTK